MSLLIASVLISVIAFLWVWVMGRNDPAGRPWLTGGCLGTLLILPVLALLPKIHLQWSGAMEGEAGASLLFSWQWVAWLWGGGAVLMLVRLGYRHWLLSRWLSDASLVTGDSWRDCIGDCQRMLGVKRLPEVRIKSGLQSPVVAGFRQPVILMPAISKAWDEPTRKMALLHEMGHVKRGDIWLRLAADMCAALHWYNPLVYWMRAKFFSQCEYACDARVIEAGVDKRCYIRALCDVVESAMGEVLPSGVLAMAGHARLSLRVDRMLEGCRRSQAWLAVVAATMTLSTALGLTLVRLDKALTQEALKSPSMQHEVELRHSANPFPGN